MGLRCLGPSGRWGQNTVRFSYSLETEDLAKGKAHLSDPQVKKGQADSGFLAPPELFFGKVI